MLGVRETVPWLEVGECDDLGSLWCWCPVAQAQFLRCACTQAFTTAIPAGGGGGGAAAGAVSAAGAGAGFIVEVAACPTLCTLPALHCCKLFMHP